MVDVSIKQIGPLQHELKIVLPQVEVETEITKFCDEIKDQAQVDGFRKGRVPLNVLRQKYGDTIKAEVGARLIHRATEDAVNERKLKIAGNPVLTDEFRTTKTKKWPGDFKFGGGFGFAIEIEVEPEVDPQGYAGITVEVDLPKPELWIQERIKKLQYDYADKTQVERSIQMGDEIVFDYAASINGQLIAEGSESWRTAIIGSGELPPGFEEKLVGLNPDDEKKFSVYFEPGFTVSRLAGQNVDFEVHIHTITEVKLHPVDDDLAQKSLYQNLAQMMTELQAKATEDFEKPRKAKVLDAVMSDILVRHPFVVPNSWVDNEMRVVAYRLGMKEMPVDIAELNGLREIAIRSVQQNFILDRIYAKEEQLRLTPEEVQAVLATEGARANKTAAEIVGLLKNAGTYEGFISFHEQQKAIEFLISSTIVKEKQNGSN